MKDLEKQVVRVIKNRLNKIRVTFSMDPSVKQALADWCRDKEIKESAALEELIRQVVPKKYF